MNILSNLKPAKGSVKKEKRIARGQGSGHGGTATRGMNGHRSRAGYSAKRNFEGGQTPIQMRLPKRGFKNINNIDYVPFNLSKLQALADKYNLSSITFESLRELRLIKATDKIKILGTGELTSTLQVAAHAYSKTAKEAIEAKGGTATIL